MTNYKSRTLNAPGETTRVVSDIVAVGTTITLGDVDALDGTKPHNFLGVELFADALGAATATGTAGDFTVTVTTSVNPQGTEAISGPVITAAALGTTSWTGNTREVVVTPSGVMGATHYRVNLAMNRS